jgi:hypothetical protein
MQMGIRSAHEEICVRAAAKYQDINYGIL